MLTPQEYIDIKPKVAWLYGLDVLTHVLQGDHNQTAYKDCSPAKGYLRSLSAELGEHKVQDDFDTIIEERYKTEYRVEPLDSEMGELDVDKFLDSNPRCFNEYHKDAHIRAGITIAFEFSMEYGARDGSEMLTTHKECYAIAAECEANQTPCRVIACGCLQIPELKPSGDRPHRGRFANTEAYMKAHKKYDELEKSMFFRAYIIVKDYQDPIFPGIWGAFKDNRSSNDFTNVLMDYLVGTRASGNGHLRAFNIEEDIEADEIQLINPRWLTCGK